MIVARNTFQVKFGRMKEALALMKEGEAMMQAITRKPQRILTDVTGAFYTLVLELEYDSLADFERVGAELMKSAGWKEWYQRFGAVVDSGRREIFSVVK
jgi:hypothetical protein